MLAGLLYLGGGLGLVLYRVAARARGSRSLAEARLTHRDAPLVAGVILCGGIIGPVLKLVGLGRLTGVVTSLLLNLEGPFTVLLALFVFREHLEAGAVPSVSS